MKVNLKQAIGDQAARNRTREPVVSQSHTSHWLNSITQSCSDPEWVTLLRGFPLSVPGLWWGHRSPPFSSLALNQKPLVVVKGKEGMCRGSKLAASAGVSTCLGWWLILHWKNPPSGSQNGGFFNHRHNSWKSVMLLCWARSWSYNSHNDRWGKSPDSVASGRHVLTSTWTVTFSLSPPSF